MTSLGAKLERWLHPIWKRMTLSSDDSVNNAIIGALDNQLSDSEQRFLKTKVETSLQTADGDWLDKWGYWFGQRRLNGWSDDEYRQHIVYHVTHGRNTIDSIKEAIANFLNVNKDSIYIYEPYIDMFILNDSLLNSNKYLPSTYYRYAVIDIRISSNIPSEVISIINLFRPAGVLWVLTHDINRFDDNAQVFDMKSPKEIYSPSISYKYFIGLVNKENYILTAGNNEYSAIENPFIYNSNSLLNSDSLLSGTVSTSKQYSIIGQSSFGILPSDDDNLDILAYQMEQPDSSENKRLINKDGIGHYFSTNLVKDNLISNASDYINGVKLNSNTGNPNLALGTATAFKMTGNGTENNSGDMYLLSSTIPKGTTITVGFDVTSTDATGVYNIRLPGGAWQSFVTAPLFSGKQHQSYTIVTANDYTRVGIRLDNSTSTVTVSNFIISESPTEVNWAPAPSEQTTSQSGSLVIPVVNLNPDCAYSFSTISTSDKDSSNASLSLILKDKLGNDITSPITNSISSGKHILRVTPNTSASFSSNGYAVISFSGISDTDNIAISLMCLKLTKTLNVPNRNLLRDTATQSSDDWYSKNSSWTPEIGTYLGSRIQSYSNAWKNSRYAFSSLAPIINLTDTYTYSIYVKVTGIDPSTLSDSYALAFESSATSANGKWTRINTLSGNEWQQVSQSLNFTTNVADSSHIYAQSLRFELATNIPDGVSVSFAAMKLEKGSVATEYSVAPEDLASNDVSSNWSPNSNDEQLANDINIELDVKSFINDNVSTLSSSVTSSDINSMFQNKRFQLTSKLNDITTPEVTVNPYVFNYNANIFMSLESFIADNNGYKDYFIDFNDVTPFINSNGIMSFKLVTENYHNGLSIDYFGLGLYNTSDEVVLKANKSQSGLGLETP